MRVLLGFESSGMTRTAFRDLGYDAWSVDLSPSEDSSPFHIQDDIRRHLRDDWDLAILHPPCTRLCNSGIRWLADPPPGRSKAEIWDEMLEGCELFGECLNSPIPHKAIENPIMHKYAKRLIPNYRPKTQSVQLHWFGDKIFKTTHYYLQNLPLLVPTEPLTVPEPGTLEHRYWTREVHNAPDNEQRATNRARTHLGIAWAMAQQWGKYVTEQNKETLQ